MYNLSTILYHIMKNPNSNPNPNPNPNFYFEPKKRNTNIKMTKLTVDIEFENKKSLELYNKLDTLKHKININRSFDKINKKHGFCIISCICIFLASFPYFNSLPFFFRSVVI